MNKKQNTVRIHGYIKQCATANSSEICIPCAIIINSDDWINGTIEVFKTDDRNIEQELWLRGSRVYFKKGNEA